MLDLSIIIVNWKTKNLLIKCINSIKKNTSNVPFEIIVIDNNSKDGTFSLRKKYPEVNFIMNDSNIGFAKAVNQGIKVGKGKNFLILNPDVFIKKNTGKLMLNKLRSENKYGAIGAKLINPSNNVEWPYVKFPSLAQIIFYHTMIKRLALKSSYLVKNFLLIDRNIEAEEQEVNLIPGGCLMIKKEVVEKIGYMDEKFSLWFEDTDFCLRIKKAGWKLIYESKAEVIHYGSGSTRKLKKDEYLRIFYTNMYRYFKKHKGSFYAFLAISIMISNMLLGIVLTFLFMPFRFKTLKVAVNGIFLRFNLIISWLKLIIDIQENEKAFS